MGQRYGNLETIVPSDFPDRALLVVNSKNLQIYIQTTSVRKMIQGEPKFDCITHYTSMNECYRIANLPGAACIAQLKPVLPTA